MKYILTGPIKFLSALILTIVWLAILAVYVPLYMIWHLEMPVPMFWQNEDYWWGLTNSGYAKPCSFKDSPQMYKSVFHCLWGASPLYPL